VNGEDCGIALAAKVNASLPEYEIRSAPNKDTVNGWKREESKLKERVEKEFTQGTSNKMCAREAKYAEMKEALNVWFRQMQGRDMTLTEDTIRSKAKQLGTQLGVPETCAFSSGWLHNFKRRDGIKSSVMHGEAGSANQEGINLARSKLLELLRERGYEAEDVYNQDESGVSGGRCPHAHWPQERALAARRTKSVQLSLCVHATGTRRSDLFVIGKAVRLRSFPKSFQPKRGLNVRYAHNKTA
jgi:hypothetical protein